MGEVGCAHLCLVGAGKERGPSSAVPCPGCLSLGSAGTATATAACQSYIMSPRIFFFSFKGISKEHWCR